MSTRSEVPALPNGGRLFTRAEIIAALAGDDLEPQPSGSATDSRYLAALTDAFAADPAGALV